MIVFILLVCASGVLGDHYVAPDGSLVLFPSPDRHPQASSSLLMSPPSPGSAPRAPRIEVPEQLVEDSRHIQAPVFQPEPFYIFPAPQPQQFSAPQPQQFSAPQPQQFSAPQPQQFSAPQPVAQPPFQPQTPSRIESRREQISTCGTPGGLVHESRLGTNYHFSWCVNSNANTWDQANSYCSNLGRGFKSVSIETKDKDDFITSVLAKHAVQFIWTSGNKKGSSTWRWSSGYSFAYTNWSHTGGFGRPQPDNREGNEDCLGVLNNFYRDGIKWHDIACHHRKPVICETSL
ncbi:uncharacterized protein [Procambarus clarkii]|uniref:uncharacterized protein n=1 Tax=Procambarus clarkii TaxID=6728 RepID=UPI003742CB9A